MHTGGLTYNTEYEMPVNLATEVLLLLLTTMMTSLQQVTSLEECSGDVMTRYISRHVDVSFEVLANYDDRSGPPRVSSALPRLRGRFNLTNRGSTAVQRAGWEIYLSSIRRMQLTDNATMLGNSGLKARIMPLQVYIGRPFGEWHHHGNQNR